MICSVSSLFLRQTPARLVGTVLTIVNNCIPRNYQRVDFKLFQPVSSCSKRQFSLPILGSHIANMIGASWRLRPSSCRQSCTDLVQPGASNGARTGPASFVLVASGGMRKGFSHFSGSRNHIEITIRSSSCFQICCFLGCC